MIRDVGDVARVLTELTNQLQQLSGSDLRTLDRLLAHTQHHVVTELNERNRRHGEN